MLKKGDRVTTRSAISYSGHKIAPGHIGAVHEPNWCGHYLVIRWDGIKELYMTLDKKVKAVIVPA